MKSYEGLFAFLPEATTDARKEHLDGLQKLIQKSGGKITQQTEWGKKPLGYPVKKCREAYFVVWQFDIDPAKLADLQKNLRLSETLVKFTLTVLQPKKPTPAERKSTSAARKSEKQPKTAAPAASA